MADRASIMHVLAVDRVVGPGRVERLLGEAGLAFRWGRPSLPGSKGGVVGQRPWQVYFRQFAAMRHGTPGTKARDGRRRGRARECIATRGMQRVASGSARLDTAPRCPSRRPSAAFSAA
ncbi:hypothetical protein BGLA2_990078 [Burkholderia gladioli]|nr:hypothetical protein BGLA2_990078 [Burkholderia gladioli]